MECAFSQTLVSQEMVLMAQLEHRNLVTGTDQWLEKNCVAHLVLQYCAGGDLAVFLQNRGGALIPEDDILIMFVQVCSRERSYTRTLPPRKNDLKPLMQERTCGLSEQALDCWCAKRNMCGAHI